MICSHCGKALGNEKLMFCVYCGYPLKGDKKGFFAKSEETGVSRAEEMANDAPNTGKPAAEHPQAAPMQNAQQIPQTNAVPPTGNAQGMGMPSPMGMQQPMQSMPGGMAQGMVPGMPGGMPQMGYGMPQMPYGMPPQMQYGMPQFAGYDAAGNPLYMQMVPQLVGYDAYGNPVYNMVAMPYVMPTVQGMPGMPPMMQQQPVYPQEQVIDVPQDQIRPAEPITPAKSTPVPMQNAPVKHTTPPPQTLHSVPFQKPSAPQPAAAPAPAPAAARPIQSVQAATLAAMEALTAFQGVSVVQDAQPVPASPYRSAQINSVYDLPMDAATLIHEDENAPQGNMPDEKALLDSIFGNKPKNYSMTEGAKPAAATFSINVGLHEIRNVKEEEFGGSQVPPPPVQSLYNKPNTFVNPFIDPGYTNPEPETASNPEPAPKPAAKKPSKPMTEKDANAAKRAAKEAKMREKEAAEAAKSGKAPKASKDKKGQKKPPARIVSPDEFFEDKPHNGTRSRSMLSVKELDKLDDGQLEAHLSSLGGATGGKKSNRSMKAATKEEMDISNIDPDALVGVGKRRLPN